MEANRRGIWLARRMALIIGAVVFAGCTGLAPGADSMNQSTSGDASGGASIQLPTPTPTPEQARFPTPTASPATLPTTTVAASLPNLGPAPELTNAVWLNSVPLRLADLRGSVVLVEFWTFGCINCQNVMPALQAWHAKYHDDGLVIVGVHTPEFAYEAELDNVQAAVVAQGITWPVAIDNEKTTWRAYANRYWPAMYLIDRSGNIRHVKIGEGRYPETAAMIEALLGESS